MVIFLYIHNVDPRILYPSKTTMARDKDTGSSGSSGIDIYTMSDIIG